jgi:peptidylprolyl isomerase domain and WD repeat-containing protein 1
MSENEQDGATLGKRPRDGDQDIPVDEESDDDVGPMPLPDSSTNGAAKKKRKGQ